MKKTAAFLIMVFLCVPLMFCTNAGTRELTQQQKDELGGLRDKGLSVTERIQDLQKQLAEAAAERAWIDQRVESAISRTVYSKSLNPRDYTVNLPDLTIRKKTDEEKRRDPSSSVICTSSGRCFATAN